MYIQQLAVLSLVAQTAQAALDSSPFLVYSTASSTWPSIRSQQLALAADVQTLSSKADCPPADLIIAHQAHLSIQQIRHMHLLRDRMGKNSNGTIIQIPKMIGRLDLEQLKSRMDAQCSEVKTEIFRLDTYRSRVPEIEAAATAADSEIASLLGGRTKPYTFLFTKGACVSDEQHEPYFMDEPFPSADHTDLRRDLSTNLELHSAVKDGKNNTEYLPLFETYQFLSPAVFMGLGVSLLLISILYVALSAISGMEISYKAFSKEMGPQTQKMK